MNVKLPPLLVSRYPRANYLKREIEHVRRYCQFLAPLKSEELVNWVSAADAKLRTDLGQPAPTPVLPGTSAVVTNGQVIAVTGGSVTLTVTAGVVTAAYTATP